ncbi:MAG: pimeloyl-ACP methyl ester carboxylesterase [Saprospiraceae bacterium]|jgi:pimeloyl-ACP methyl ester carboxylesterase|tara:strand:- start:203 stop:1048 length:846 start_codon:yes stop_codon:yes gene_type:complete
MFKLDAPLEITTKKYTDEASKFVVIDKMNIHYKEEGEGKVFVLLHDAGTSLNIWEEWMPFLIAHYKVIRLDLPGFGLSPQSKKFDYKMDSYIYFIKKFTAAMGLGLEMFHIGGIGFGGHLAWQYTLLHPHKILKLLLINPQGQIVDKTNNLFSFENKGSFGRFILRWKGSRRSIKKQLSRSVGNKSVVTDLLVEQTQDLLICKGNRKSLKILAKKPLKSRYDKILEIKTPTFIQFGSLTVQSDFSKDIPKAKSKTYEGIGALPMIESPEQTAKDVIHFLDS